MTELKTNGVKELNAAFARMESVIAELNAKYDQLKGDSIVVSSANSELPEVDVVENIDALREEAKSLSIKGWHVMGADKLREKIEQAKLNQGA